MVFRAGTESHDFFFKMNKGRAWRNNKERKEGHEVTAEAVIWRPISFDIFLKQKPGGQAACFLFIRLLETTQANTQAHTQASSSI
jgi:hypothetical protein